MTYACTNTSGMPTNFTLKLKVKVTNLYTNCDAEADDIASAEGDSDPTVDVTADPVPLFCALDGSVNATFNVTSSVDYSPTSWTLNAVVFNVPPGLNTPDCGLDPSTPQFVESSGTNSKFPQQGPRLALPPASLDSRTACFALYTPTVLHVVAVPRPQAHAFLSRLPT